MYEISYEMISEVSLSSFRKKLVEIPNCMSQLKVLTTPSNVFPISLHPQLMRVFIDNVNDHLLEDRFPEGTLH